MDQIHMAQDKVQGKLSYIVTFHPYKPQISSPPLQWLLHFQGSGPVWWSPLLTIDESHEDRYREKKHIQLCHVIDLSIWK
jgi:hypothetical protein